MTDITALRDFALDHPDKAYLREAADEIERLKLDLTHYEALQVAFHNGNKVIEQQEHEIERLTRDLKASRQDNGAVIAQLQNDIREARAESLIPGLEEAVRVIEGMNTDWPDAIGRSLGDDYGRQFASRIRDRIESTKRAEREQCARIAESFTRDYPDVAPMARRIAEVIRRRSRATREEMERSNERQDQ